MQDLVSVFSFGICLLLVERRIVTCWYSESLSDDWEQSIWLFKSKRDEEDPEEVVILIELMGIRFRALVWATVG